MPDEIEFTQKITVHLNGGSEFSELHHRIYADGRETGITRHKRTNGSPKYLITDDVFKCGADEFDVLATNRVGLMEWLKAHAESRP